MGSAGDIQVGWPWPFILQIPVCRRFAPAIMRIAFAGQAKAQASGGATFDAYGCQACSKILFGSGHGAFLSPAACNSHTQTQRRFSVSMLLAPLLARRIRQMFQLRHCVQLSTSKELASADESTHLPLCCSAPKPGRDAVRATRSLQCIAYCAQRDCLRRTCGVKASFLH
jgi:hypothetical protein